MEHGAALGPVWLEALEHSGLGRTLRGSLWLFPAVETLHILGFAILVGAIVTFDARVVAARPGLDLAGWQRAVLPVARLGFLLALPMGLLLFTVEATAYWANPMFRAKLVLLLLALGNIVLWHRLAARSGWPSARVRWSAAVSLLLWLLVVVAGRLIAYV